MSVDGVKRIFGKGAKVVGVDWFSPHGLRGAFCSDFLGANIDLMIKLLLVGWVERSATQQLS